MYILLRRDKPSMWRGICLSCEGETNLLCNGVYVYLVKERQTFYVTGHMYFLLRRDKPSMWRGICLSCVGETNLLCNGVYVYLVKERQTFYVTGYMYFLLRRDKHSMWLLIQKHRWSNALHKVLNVFPSSWKVAFLKLRHFILRPSM